MKYLIPLLLLTSCSTKRIINTFDEIVVVDSTRYCEDPENPGMFSPVYDTVVVVSQYKYNLITGKQIVKHKIKH